MAALVGSARRILRDERPRDGHILKQEAVLPREGHVHATGQQRDHRPAPFQRAPNGAAVNALGDTGRHQRPVGGQLHAKPLRPGLARLGAFAHPHHGDGRLLVKAEGLSPDIQHHRRRLDLPQPLGVIGVLKGHDTHAQPVAVPQNPVGPVHALVQQRLPGKRGQRQGLVVLPLPVVGPLRGDKMVDYRQRARRAKALTGGQPQPVFQLRHRLPPPFL